MTFYLLGIIFLWGTLVGPFALPIIEGTNSAMLIVENRKANRSRTSVLSQHEEL